MEFNFNSAHLATLVFQALSEYKELSDEHPDVLELNQYLRKWFADEEEYQVAIKLVTSLIRPLSSESNVVILQGPGASGKTRFCHLLHSTFGQYVLAADGTTSVEHLLARQAKLIIFYEAPDQLTCGFITKAMKDASPPKVKIVFNQIQGDTLKINDAQVLKFKSNFVNEAQLTENAEAVAGRLCVQNMDLAQLIDAKLKHAFMWKLVQLCM